MHRSWLLGLGASDDRGVLRDLLDGDEDARQFNEWCAVRAKTDPLFLKCGKYWFGYNEHAMESYAKRKKVPWRKGLTVDYLPHPTDEHGSVDTTRENTIFAFRDYDYTGPLAKFNYWHIYEETDQDREFKAQIEELGFELGPWTIVSSVGPQGLFYNFSAETIRWIQERMKIKKQEKLERAKGKKEQEQAVEGTGASSVPALMVV
ncbi:hypothetical protein FRC08_001102 [Ceratobasidium sp. 394]|nr:hypothetical protein FRC08_001102 [Ceratobasidium sp. 394]KAG9094692.1 hypothetical protein FS749_012009 [Ceratobasidium sp. UAMH 11750]